MVTEAEALTNRDEKDQAEKDNPHIQELDRRIDGMARWKIDLEKAVYVHRKEHRRIALLLGKKDGSWSEKTPDETEEQWGVGGKKWEKEW